ncbi:glycosyltransferase [Zoogloea sp.]|uniref:glycosyltransferase n=1 Tax=Zoogloea sp. TaxID=49181 RepID=UPI0035AE5C31
MSVRVCHVVESLDNTYGGPARSIPSLCAALRDCDVESTIHSVDSPLKASNEVVSSKELVWKQYAPTGPAFLRYSSQLNALEGFCVNESVDIVHLHSLWTYPSYVAWRVAKRIGIPLVLSARSNLYAASLKRSAWKKGLAKVAFVSQLLEDVECIHATSDEEASEIEALGLKKAVRVVGNGVSVSEFDVLPERTSAKAHLDLSDESFVLLFFSRVHPRKGLHRLVSVWSALAKEHENLVLVVAGPNEDPVYFSEILKSVRDKGLESRFKYLGMLGGQSRLAVMSASDVFVLPTDFENFGMAIAEAMAARLPVITTHGTPWRELPKVDAGWWIDTSEEALMSALLNALSLKDRLPNMGVNGRRFVEEHYGWGAAAKEMRRVYEEILRS